MQSHELLSERAFIFSPVSSRCFKETGNVCQRCWSRSYKPNCMSCSCVPCYFDTHLVYEKIRQPANFLSSCPALVCCVVKTQAHTASTQSIPSHVVRPCEMTHTAIVSSCSFLHTLLPEFLSLWTTLSFPFPFPPFLSIPRPLPFLFLPLPSLLSFLLWETT